MENTMLIVDDNEINREILKLLFEHKYEILEAESGEEALETLQICQGNIDIVLLDLIMPGLSGVELLKQRQELNYFKNVPVVVISSTLSPEDQIEVFSLGASDFINKPFIPEIVVSRVDNVMASHRRLMSVEVEAQLLKVKSEVDQMTGLLNKTTTEVTINEILKNNTRQQLHALLVIDMDNFKAVNDLAGHLSGDHVIKIVADLISGYFRKKRYCRKNRRRRICGADDGCAIHGGGSREGEQADSGDEIQTESYDSGVCDLEHRSRVQRWRTVHLRGAF